MSIWEAVLQGIVQGLTEFLPVSSSGHLSLIQYFTGQSGEVGAFFSILLHLGTLLAVIIAFFPTILELVVEFFHLIGEIFRGRFSWRHANANRRMILLLIVSCLPLALTLVLKDWFEGFSTDNSIVAEGVFFLITSALLFISVNCPKGRKSARDMTLTDALAIGTVQAIAPLPGVSRSGSTISAGLLLGLDRKFAVQFSFIMGIPAVLGANILEIGTAMRDGLALPLSLPVILAGLGTALVFGLLAIKMVNWLVTEDKFTYFAWYTLVLGVLTIGLGIYENVAGHPLQQIILGWMAA